MMHKQRVDWINEGRPKPSVTEDGEDVDVGDQAVQGTGGNGPKQASRIAPIFDMTASTARSKTPDADLFGDEDDIYNATPVGAQTSRAAADKAGEPDEDELDALMAETEGTRGPANPAGSSRNVVGSIFGNGRPSSTTPAQAGDEDDLDALIAEAEAAQDPGQRRPPPEAGRVTDSSRTMKSGGGGDEDDLDALIAEAEAQSGSRSRPPAIITNSNPSVKPSNQNFADEEEAMAEMDGLW